MNHCGWNIKIFIQMVINYLNLKSITIDIKTTQSLNETNPYSRDKLFVDYSGFNNECDRPLTGEISKVQIFVAVLGASGYTFVHATKSQTLKDFISLIQKALTSLVVFQMYWFQII